MYPASLRPLCHSLLNEGVELLQLPVGIVSHIYFRTYQIVAINTASGPLIEGASFPLDATYCRDVFERGEVLAITQIDGIPGMRRHPLYVKMPLEAYIGAPISVRGRVWGTVNFTSTRIHTPFTTKEIAAVKRMAKQVEGWLAAASDRPQV